MSQIMIGNDLVYIERFKRSLALNSFVEKIFHTNERAACEKKADKTSSYAARFAAKEAFSKALGTGLYAQGVTPQDVWVEQHDSGKPYLCFSPRLQNILKARAIVGHDVSLSHHGDYALAHVLLWCSV